MGRDSYDDMVSPDRQRRGRGTNRITGLIVVFGILICAIALLVHLIRRDPDPCDCRDQTAGDACLECCHNTGCR